MSDFQKPIGNRDKSPTHWIAVQKIEQDKKGKEEPYSKEPKPEIPKSVLFATFVSFFKKIVTSFFSKERKQVVAAEKHPFVEDLIAFKKMLQILANENQSHNPEFIQQLSELWHNLLDDCNRLASFERKKIEAASKVKLFITKILSYPPSEDHSLGYYLTEYAGKEWLPFPYMDILDHLHEEYTRNPRHSTLTEWIGDLSSILSFLEIPQENI